MGFVFYRLRIIGGRLAKMLAVGLDLGGHTLSGALAEVGGKFPRIISGLKKNTPEGRVLDDVVRLIADITEELAAGKEVDFLGIGVPGFLDSSRTKITKFTNFSGLENVGFLRCVADSLKKRGIFPRLAMENDANCFAMGEAAAGLAVGCSDFIVLTLGTGIGSGIFANGRLITGAHGMAGEAGHIPMSDVTEPKCGCGSGGHLETLSSADYIEKRARAEGLPEDLKLLWNMRHDRRANRLVSESLDTLARGIAAISALLDPEKIILCGGMSRASGIAEELHERTVPWLPIPLREHLMIEVSTMGDDAALLGAAVTAMERGVQTF